MIIDSFTPDNSTNDRDISITITGTGFKTESISQVWLNCTGLERIFSSSFSVISDTQASATFTLSGVVPGSYLVTLRTISSARYQSKTPFRIFFSKPPAITEISPGSGKIDMQPYVCLIKGDNFYSGSHVQLVNTSGGIFPVTSTWVDCYTLLSTFSVDGEKGDRYLVQIINPDTQISTDIVYFTSIDNPPLVFSVSPDTGSKAESSYEISAIGTGFLSGCVLSLHDPVNGSVSSNMSPTIVSADGMTVSGLFDLTGFSIGEYEVLVENPDGQMSNITVLFTVSKPYPVVTGITPNTGINSGSVTFTKLAGKDFMSGAVVNLTKSGQMNITATSVKVISPSELSGTFPITGATAGTWNITVTNTDGEVGSLTNGFTIYNPRPMITSLTPNNEPIKTHTADYPVTVTGSNFVSGCRVTLNGNFRPVMFTSSTSLTVTFLASDDDIAGCYPLVITNPTPSEGQSLPVNYVVRNTTPTINTISPASGKQGGKYSIIITGTNFETGKSIITVSGTGVSVGTYKKRNATTIIVPVTIGKSAKTGPRTITVTNPTNRATVSAKFTVTGMPLITRISPAVMQQGKTYTITITGNSFEAGKSTVAVSGTGVSVGAYKKRNATTIIAPFTIGKGAKTGPRTVTITNPTNKATVSAKFTVTGVPSITSISQVSGAAKASIPMIIKGKNFFSSTATLKKGSTRITGSSTRGKTSTENTLFITFPIAGKPAGVYNLTVQNSNGASATKFNAFNVIGSSGSMIKTVLPISGANTADRKIEITGNGFRAGAVVLLTNGVTTYRIKTNTCLGSTSLLVTLPLKAKKVPAGLYSIVVMNPDGTFSSKSNCYRVTAKTTSKVATSVSAGDMSRSTMVTGREVNTGPGQNVQSITPPFIAKFSPTWFLTLIQHRMD